MVKISHLRRLALALSVGWYGCAGEEPEAPDLQGALPPPTLDLFITGGAIDNGHPAVGMLRSGGAGCTATLIGSKTVLTAAHCVPSSSATFTVAGKQVGGQTVRHPSYSSGANDVAVVRLSQAVTDVPPAVLNTSAPQVGQGLIIVGFGKTGESSGSFGTKRVGQNTIDQVGETRFYFEGNANVCNGDSGGPSFVLAGGVEQLAGVHSQKRNHCGYGGIDMRVDAYASWIQSVATEPLGTGAGSPGGSGGSQEGGGTPPAPVIAGQGESCLTNTCAQGLACTTVFSGSTAVGRYCMEVCSNPGGSDPVCDGGEQCTNSRTAGPVCFNPRNASQGYTDPDPSTPSQPAPEPSPQPAPEPAPPAGGSPALATEGQSCQGTTCAAQLACTTVFSGSNPVGSYCMEICSNPGGSDPICESGESCINSRTAGPVCFNPRNPSQGYTTPSASSPPPGQPQPPPVEPLPPPPPPPGDCDPSFLGPFCTQTTCDAAGNCNVTGNTPRIIGFDMQAPASPTLAQIRAYSLAAVNAIRARTCLPPLVADACLDRIAEQAQAANSGHGYFIQNCMNGAHNYGRNCECNWAQENIGAASGTSRTWVDGVQSPLCRMMTERKGTGHRSNIEADVWRRLGVGIKWSSSGASWYHEFGCDPTLASCPKK